MRRLWLSFLIVLLATSAQAATYWVALTGGTTAGSCAASSGASDPNVYQRTIQAGVNCATVAGDTVMIKDGTYTITSTISLTNAGTSGAKITIRSQNKWGAKITGGSGVNEPVRFEANHVRVQDLEVFGFVGNGTVQGNNALIDQGSHTGLHIIGNHIHSIGERCTDTQYGQDGMYLSHTVDSIIENNVIHNIGRFKQGESGCSCTVPGPGGLCYVNHDHAIYVDGGTNVTIRNNLIYDMAVGYGMQIYPGNLNGINIFNNTIDMTGGSVTALVFGNESSPSQTTITNALVQNNIFYGVAGLAGSFAVQYVSVSISASTFSFNIVQGGSIAPAQTGVTLASNTNNTDPLFTNRPTDYSLQFSSPAKDTGTTIASVTTDILGTSRPQNAIYDKGAYERVVAAGPAVLVAQYLFDEGSGTAPQDNTANNLDGTMTGGASYVSPGRVGAFALNVDGVDGIVTVSDNVPLDIPTFTLMAWVRPDALVSGFKAVLVKDYVYYLYATGGGGGTFPLGGFNDGSNRTVVGTSAIPTTSWTHLAVTYDGTTIRLYRNGVEENTTTFASTVPSSGGVLTIGASLNAGEYFDGRVDDARVYTGAVDAATILAIYNAAGAEVTNAPAAPVNLRVIAP